MPASARLPSLLRFAPVPVASLDLDGRICDANDALLAASGYSRDELVGKPFATFIDSVSELGPRGNFDALAAGVVDSYHVQRRFITKHGDAREVDLSVSLVRDADGTPQISLAVLQDVTPHRRALEEAARRAAELEAVIDSLPAAIYIGDEQGIIKANRAGLEQLGFQSAAELHQPISRLAARLESRDAVTAERIQWQEGPFMRALGGERVDREVVSKHLVTGEEVVQRVIAAPVLLSGRIIGAVAISTNITEQKRTENALKLSEARYRALVEQSPFSVQILSPDGRTIQVNAAWERLWGVTLEQIAGYNILEDQQLVDRGIMPGILRGFAGEPCELPATVYDPNQTIPHVSSRPDPRCWVRALIYPIKDEHGRIREVVLFHEDISDKIRAEEERQRVQAEREQLLVATQRAHREAETASRVKDEFLATLSHELRTPLNAVIGWLRILRAGESDPRTTHALDVIERNAWAQTRMIDDLLDVSRIVTGKFNVALEEIDVGAAALSAIESVRPAATAKRIRLLTRIADDLPRLPADAPRLQQVFWNLLSNAVKFTDAGGEVTMTIDHDRHTIAIVVRDTGVGISPEVIPHIFDRFTQGDSSTTRVHAGLGLGLSIVRHVVALHGGSVSAASEGPNRGATFRVVLPLRANRLA